MTQQLLCRNNYITKVDLSDSYMQADRKFMRFM